MAFTLASALLSILPIQVRIINWRSSIFTKPNQRCSARKSMTIAIMITAIDQVTLRSHHKPYKTYNQFRTGLKLNRESSKTCQTLLWQPSWSLQSPTIDVKSQWVAILWAEWNQDTPWTLYLWSKISYASQLENQSWMTIKSPFRQR